jgi:hypothetical protein
VKELFFQIVLRFLLAKLWLSLSVYVWCVVADSAACIAASSLKHMLNSQDALLGPWMPGRDMLEDELRTFVGEYYLSMHKRRWNSASWHFIGVLLAG